MTTHSIRKVNKATKQSVEVERWRTAIRRKHGRPRNVGRIVHVRKLPVRNDA